MHVTNWEEAQGEDTLLATCRKWMSTKKDVPLQKRDALLKTCMGEHSDLDEGKALFRASEQFHHEEGNAVREHHMPKGKTEGLLAFMVPSAHQCAALYGVH